MAESMQVIERTSMYKCDYDDLTLLGTRPVFASAPSVDEIGRIDRIISECGEALESAGDTLPVGISVEDRQFVLDMWVFRFDECATEFRGQSISDLLFVARCHQLCCAKPKIRTMALFNDIQELYVRVLLLGTNHTRARFRQQDSPSDVESLEHRCASLIVYELSQGPDEIIARLSDTPLPQIDVLLLAQVNPLRSVPDIIKPTEEELTEEADRKAKAKAKARRENPGVTHDDSDDDEENKDAEYDVNEGNYWHTDKDTIVRGFVRMASRVFRNYWLQRMIFDRYPVRDLSNLPLYADNVKKNFVNWLETHSKCDYANDSVKVYRDLVYEYWMPDGSRQETLRYFVSKYENMQPLNLLEHQLGVNSTTSLANMARVQVKLTAASTESETYDFYMLSQFAELIKFDTDAEFMSDYVIKPGELCFKRKRLECKTTWGRPRRPILLRIMRGWFIHDAGEWVPCTDMCDALLKLMTLWRSNYESCFVGCHNPSKIERWIKRVTEPTNDDDYMDNAGVESDDD